MSPDELMGMAIFFGSIVAIIFIITVGSIIKAWVKKDSSKSLTENRVFLDALREFKENMETRMSALEEIVSAEKYTPESRPSLKEKRNSKNAIELDLENEDLRETTESTNLRNMLNH